MAGLALVSAALADEPPGAPPQAAEAGLATEAGPVSGATVHVGYLGQRITRPLPHSFLEAPPTDEGVAGARVGISDDNTTGSFTGQKFVLDHAIVPQAAAFPPASPPLLQAA